MQEDHPHVQLAHRLWDAAARGDAEALRGIYAARVVLHFAGDNPMAGTYRGRDAMLGFLARTGELVDELRSDLLDVYAGDRGAVIHYRVKASAAAHRLDVEYLASLHIVADRVVAVRMMATDAAHNDAFWRAVASEPLSSPAI